ncbi:Uncharacterized protein APZ42_007501 [Daphnia magna]|uniref:Uncharacterized protein n=1 Tax=Daphnia magna TaxID=35525 RepID=A0A164F8W5_9CRUS|nr:Uncharacterized protein APZ42_007501 [Daphnia magna]
MGKHVNPRTTRKFQEDTVVVQINRNRLSALHKKKYKPINQNKNKFLKNLFNYFVLKFNL